MIKRVEWTYIPKSNLDLIFVIGSGPSVKNVDLNRLNESGYCIVVNDVANNLPDANAWFTLDPWGLHKNQLNPDFKGTAFAAVPDDYGTRYAASPDHRIMPRRKFNYLCRVPQNFDENKMQRHRTWGLNEDPRCINSGNSGFGALNLAFHMRPKKIALVGIDCTSGYFFNERKRTRPLNHLLPLFSSSTQQLKRENIEVVDCSMKGKLNCFPKEQWENLVK